MSLNIEDEILQDFLVEAGELLEGLNEQLVELERNPGDLDLLNAVFRSFHTIKGGAGFLNLTHLVTVCHRAEDVFNVLRQQRRQVDGILMDAVLSVLDVVNAMFEEIGGGKEPEPADSDLIALLEALAVPAEAASPGDASAAAGSAAVGVASEAVSVGSGRFAATIGGNAPAEVDTLGAASAPAQSGDLITDDEFERLLDQLHGKGGPPGATASEPAMAVVVEPAAVPGDVGVAADSPPPRSGEPTGDRRTVAPAASAAEATVRVDTKRLDEIMNLVGELVLVRNRLETLRPRIQDEQVNKAVSNLDLVTADLRTAVMKTRMQPIKKVFGRFPRVVRDLARSLGKEIELELRGEETELDKNLVEVLADPLVHLVRNAVDHGIEEPAERERVGKPRTGRVVLAAAQEGDHILLRISDDGRGMDPELLRRKAVEKGMLEPEAAARLSDADAFNLILSAGFTTKTVISDVSGRGVGMDVVKTRIAELNGSVEIDSTLGSGSTLKVKVPLTLAILPALMVMLGERPFALPLANVSELVRLEPSLMKRVDDQDVLMVRNQALPLYDLTRWLARRDGAADRQVTRHVVIVLVANRRVGLVVDRLIGQEEVVIKPLGSILHGLPGFAGATITGDGGIALILDVPSLLRAYGRQTAKSGDEPFLVQREEQVC